MIPFVLAAMLPVLATGNQPSGAIKLEVPRVQYRFDEASATSAPWIDANGWRILRDPGAEYYYDVPSRSAALSAAEAFVYGAHASIHTDAEGQAAFKMMLGFLQSVPEADLPPLANIGVVDDGSPETGELMNLLSRHNLLYRIVKAPDPKLNLTVQIGSPEFPRESAQDPAMLAQKIRGQIGDDHRLVRLYGSEVVIARLLGSGDRLRLHLLNFSNRHVLGLRVRVLGEYPHQTVFAAGKTGPGVEAISVQDGATEFTVPDLGTYAVIDMTR